MKGQLGGYTAGIRKRIRALGLSAEIEQQVLRAVVAKNGRIKVKLGPRIKNRIIDTIEKTGGPVVLTFNNNKWTVFNMDGYMKRAGNLAGFLDGHKRRKLGNGSNGHIDNKEVSSRMLAGVTQ